MSMTKELAQRLEWSAKNGSEIILDSSESQALVEALEAKDKEISKLRSVIQASRKYVVVLESQLNGGGVNG